MLLPPPLRVVIRPRRPVHCGERLEQLTGALRPLVRLFREAGEHDLLEFSWNRKLRALGGRHRRSVHVRCHDREDGITREYLLAGAISGAM
jgi:hypothetical protein